MTAAIGVSGCQCLGERIGEVLQLIPKRDLERARLIQEARAIYEGIFPTEKARSSCGAQLDTAACLRALERPTELFVQSAKEVEANAPTALEHPDLGSHGAYCQSRRKSRDSVRFR